jgi:hypothetical protein
MRPLVSTVLEVSLALTALAVAAPAQCQTAGATPRTPELLGLYPGMPMTAARTQLQKHSKTAPVLSNTVPDSGFSMMIPDSRDQTNVFLTRAPNESAVWMIQRSQNFTATEPMSETALLTALREKYGKETLTMDRGGGGLYLFWIFDQSGKLRSTADQGLTGCSGGSFINYSVNGPPQTPNSIEQACFQSFFAVTAMLNRHDAQMLQAYTVELVNIPYAVSAATNTLNANNAAADKARQDLLIKANQKKPSF